MRILVVMMALSVSGCACVSFASQFHGCESYADARYHDGIRDITHYVVPSNLVRSPLGVPIGPGVDGKAVDAAFTDVAACLGVPFRACGVHAVIIAPDWQDLSAVVLTGSKVPTEVFPCNGTVIESGMCTGANQWPATIVITPNMHALRWEAERMLLKDDPNHDGGRNCWQPKGAP